VSLDPDVREKAILEMADVFSVSVRLADKLDANLIEAAKRKLAINAQKVPCIPWRRVVLRSIRSCDFETVDPIEPTPTHHWPFAAGTTMNLPVGPGIPFEEYR